MIKADNISVEFNGMRILNNLSFELEPGGTLVVLGKNGSGKSVLLKTIAGLISEFSGDIIIDGIKTGGKGAVSTEAAFERMAYVFQKGGLFDSIDVFENVAFGLRRRKFNAEKIEEKVLSSLERVGLKNAFNKYPSELSGGMQKRVGLARAISLGADIILYDDPTAGLDPILSDAIADLINDISADPGATSIVATHDLKVAEKIADKIILLYTGKAVFYGSSAEFFSRSDSFAKQFIEGDIEGPIDVYKL